MLVFSVLFLIPTSACADSSSCFSVEVPTSLALYQASDGDVITPSAFKIANTGNGPIAVSSITVAASNGYCLKDFSLNFEDYDVGEKYFALKFDGYGVLQSGAADLTGIPFLAAGESHNIAVSALCSPSGTAKEDEIIADILVVVSWQPGRLYSVTVSKNPDKTLYLEGDNFSSEGMEITGKYYGGASERIENYSIPDGTNLKSGTSHVTVLVNSDGSEKTCQVPIKVNPSLTSIEITALPSVTSYIAGDSFNSSGMVVNALYSDGTRKLVTTYGISPKVLSCSDKSVTVSYEENGIRKTAAVNVTVRKSLSYIKIETPPSKTAYSAGDTFSSDGAVVYAVFSDGTKEDVTKSVYWSPKTVTSGMSFVTASYTSDGITGTAKQSITVIKKLSSIEITSYPYKTSYFEGDDADLTGLKLKLHYSDGSEEETDNYTFSPSKLTASDDKIIISYGGKSASVPVNVSARRSIDSCDISLGSETYTYSKSAVTPKVNVSYCGESLKEGTDYELTYLNNINAGTASVTVSGKGSCTGSRTLDFEILKKEVSVSWVGTSFVCKNTFFHPTAVLDGVISGDDCDAVLDSQGNVAPGNYKCRVLSLTNSNYCLSSSFECSYEITAGSVPCFAPGSIPDKLSAAGYEKQGGEYRIRSVIFSPCYTPTGEETLSLTLDVYHQGEIVGYIKPCCTYEGYTYSDLIISSNGSVSIMTNTDSSYLFAGICHYLNDSLGGGFVNLSMLDTQHAITMSYMFANLTLKELDLTNFYLPYAMTADHMFYMSDIGSITIGGMNTAHITDMSYMFAGCSGMDSVNLSKLDTSHAENMASMFEDTGFSEIFINFDTSACTNLDCIFGGSSSRLSTIHEKNTYSVSGDASSALPFDGNPNFAGINQSGISALRPTNSGGVFLNNPYV